MIPTAVGVQCTGTSAVAENQADCSAFCYTLLTHMSLCGWGRGCLSQLYSPLLTLLCPGVREMLWLGSSFSQVLIFSRTRRVYKYRSTFESASVLITEALEKWKDWKCFIGLGGRGGRYQTWQMLQLLIPKTGAWRWHYQRSTVHWCMN